jgi:hypothetical protein
MINTWRILLAALMVMAFHLSARGADEDESVELSIEALTATLERPLFVRGRRPPAPEPVAVMPSSPPPTPVVEAVSTPQATLVGVIKGDGQALALLNTAGKIVALRQGETIEDWQITDVAAREVTFQHGERTVVLKLKDLSEPAPASTSGAPPAWLNDMQTSGYGAAKMGNLAN